MENFYGAHATNISFTVKKKRSSMCRRPCSDSQKLLQGCTLLSASSQFLGGGSYLEGYQCKERTVGLDGSRSERKQMKLKLKLGGVIQNVHAKSQAGYTFNDDTSCRYSHPYFDASEPREKFYQNVSFSRDNSLSGKIYDKNAYEPVRKSKRVPKRRIMDGGFNENYDLDSDEEIQDLGTLASSEETCQGKAKTADGRQMDNVIYADGENYGSSKLSKYGRNRLRSKNLYGSEDYIGEESKSDDGDEHRYQRKRFGNEGHNGSITFAHNLSHQSSGNDVLLKTGASFLEFPDGLLAAPPKKQKAKPSEVAQQTKKAEAAQRRRLQAEKAAREAEAEAIRKILGQDSGRRKQEKIKKQLNELAQAKAAEAQLGSNTIRWVIGPAGTIVIFSDDIGLPGIFNSISRGYPPAREKCAGPDCTNAYKYRDSKSRVPLCSLKCYKAIHGRVHPVITC